MYENNRSSSVVSGRKGATAATVVLAVILSLAIGGGASWFFMAGAEARVREALRQEKEQRQRQSQRALAQLQGEIQPNLDSALDQLKRLNYGTGVEELQEALDKCDLVMSALVEEDAARAGLLKQGLEEAKALAQAGNPTVLEQVQSLQRGGAVPGSARHEPIGEPQPGKGTGGVREKSVPAPEGAVPGVVPPVEGKGTMVPPEPQSVTPPEKAAPGAVPPLEGPGTMIPPEEGGATPAEKQVGPQLPSPPPFAP